MTEVTNNINDIVEKISNLNIDDLNIDDETGEIKVTDVPNVVEIRRSGRVKNEPIRLTYEVQSKKNTIKGPKKEVGHKKNNGTIKNKKPKIQKKPQEKTKDVIVNTNDNREITIVLDVTSGCTLYNNRSSISLSNKTKKWKEDMQVKIEEIMNVESLEIRYNELINYRNNLSNNCNFWMTKKMLEEYSNILKKNKNWIEHQQEIVDLYKRRHQENQLSYYEIINELTGDNLKQKLTTNFENQLINELNNEVQKVEQLEKLKELKELEELKHKTKKQRVSESKQESKQDSTPNQNNRYSETIGGLYRKTKKITKKQNKSKSTKKQNKSKSTKKQNKSKSTKKSTKKVKNIKIKR